MSELTKQEEMLFKTAKHEIMTELDKMVSAALSESILRLRGVGSQNEREQIKEEVIKKMRISSNKILDI